MLSPITKTFSFGQQTITLETGKLAQQATSSVEGTIGDTRLLVTLVVSKDSPEDRNFLPLGVHYLEKFYAAGRLPGGFNKREARPSEREVLISRLIDRSIRPLFPKGFNQEVQIIITVLSIDPRYETDILAILATSAALLLSGLPCHGPLAAARVGYQDDSYLLNPTTEQLEQSKLDLVVAGSSDAVFMVESEAKELPEPIMLGAVEHGHQALGSAIDAITDFVQSAQQAGHGREALNWQLQVNTALEARVKDLAYDQIVEAYTITQKQKREERMASIAQDVVQQLMQEAEFNHASSEKEIKTSLDVLKRGIVRKAILTQKKRIDGRDLDTVRPINLETGRLPRAHGDALFTRGETQVLAAVTLGTERDAQLVDEPFNHRRDRLLFHYNFPPYSVCECSFLGSPKRREIGHGRLARRGIEAVMPDLETFPYTIRVVFEVLASNGSSSMASVCSGSAALMQAGVPIKAPVAGIAMGLIVKENKEEEGDEFAILTDILGDEDFLGDMDFKVAGTAKGVLALQMDIKVRGINHAVMQEALEKAKIARLHILDKMNACIDRPKQELSAYAPQFLYFKISPDKIRDVIGKGGSNIRQITEETGVTVDIADDGSIKIVSTDLYAAQEARKRIEELAVEAKVGTIYEGLVVKVMDFGAFVTLFPGTDGFLHISQITGKRVNNINDYLKQGQKVRVKVLEIDQRGRIRLTMMEA